LGATSEENSDDEGGEPEYLREFKINHHKKLRIYN
jgi:hypothetical protein